MFGMQEGDERRQKAREEIRGWLKSLFFALVLVLVFRAHVAEGYQIRGASMKPTLEDDDRLFVEKVTPRFRSYRPGDIVVFPHPREGKKLIKRVAAVGGQAVEIRDGYLWIDGERQVEGYILNEDWARWDEDFGVVPEGKLFLLGDNRLYSNDSRTFSSGRYIAEDDVVGRAFVRFWPVRRFRFFP
jgi:signal peptidase I